MVSKERAKNNNEYAINVDTILQALSHQTKQMLDYYFKQWEGDRLIKVYPAVLEHIERPLFELMLIYTGGNQSRTAIYLGLNRGTLRKKLKQYGFIS